MCFPVVRLQALAEQRLASPACLKAGSLGACAVLLPSCRALRPDRLTSAMTKFVQSMIGPKYVTSQPYDLERSFQDSSPGECINLFHSR